MAHERLGEPNQILKTLTVGFLFNGGAVVGQRIGYGLVAVDHADQPFAQGLLHDQTDIAIELTGTIDLIDDIATALKVVALTDIAANQLLGQGQCSIGGCIGKAYDDGLMSDRQRLSQIR